MDPSHGLYYHTSATGFHQSLPLGNGRIGASLISSGHVDTLLLNEVTFWSGQPYEPQSQYGGKAAINEMRELYIQKDHQAVQALAEKWLQPPKGDFGTNLGVGRLKVEYSLAGEVTASKGKFERGLRLDEGIGWASYTSADSGTRISRETFVSHPHQVIAMRISTNNETHLSCNIRFQGETKSWSTKKPGAAQLEIHTQALETVHSDGTCGVKLYGLVHLHSDGQLLHTEDTISVANASSVVILAALNTDYLVPHHKDWISLARTQIQTALEAGYDKLKRCHIEDHQSLYSRVTLTLGPPSSTSQLPTDQRQKALAATKGESSEDLPIYALYFNYGRYLLIAGTRSDSPLPLHLQGLWNDREANAMNWSCDYHLDINTQMNYFPLEPCGLGDECHAPLARYMQTLAAAGNRSAKNFYGTQKGWVAHVFSNVWGFTAPGWETSWGLNVTGGLWMALEMKEHWEYTLDKAYLKGYAWDVLKAAAEFFLEYMSTADPKKGLTVTGPSVSPENTFFVEEQGRREEHSLSLSPTLDVVLVRDLLAFCLDVAPSLGGEDVPNDDFIQKAKKAMSKLPPLQIGRHGQLQEWLEDFEEAQPDHRHMSHIVALIRSSQISKRHTPALAEAVRVTLERRRARADLEDIEFTAVLFAMGFARLDDGDAALKPLTHLISELSFENLLTFSKPGIAGAETNIFVVDGNFGATAAVAELLLRSVRVGEVEILPALPTKWRKSGQVKGLRAKGNLVVGVQWSEGMLVEATIQNAGQAALSARVYYQERSVEVELQPAATVTLDQELVVR
ncbi:Glycosyl hydrolase family 65, domain-containing protein [Cladophialophora immunda]|nr:Glycosyl hydrolase family 65, domain-containing protein [Cladophialophora immunda]